MLLGIDVSGEFVGHSLFSNETEAFLLDPVLGKTCCVRSNKSVPVFQIVTTTIIN